MIRPSRSWRTKGHTVRPHRKCPIGSADAEDAPSPNRGRLEISDAYREWHESCPCFMSKAVPDIKQALDEEGAANATS